MGSFSDNKKNCPGCEELHQISPKKCPHPPVVFLANANNPAGTTVGSSRIFAFVNRSLIAPYPMGKQLPLSP